MSRSSVVYVPPILAPANKFDQFIGCVKFKNLNSYWLKIHVAEQQRTKKKKMCTKKIAVARTICDLLVLNLSLWSFCVFWLKLIRFWKFKLIVLNWMSWENSNWNFQPIMMITRLLLALRMNRNEILSFHFYSIDLAHWMISLT